MAKTTDSGQIQVKTMKKYTYFKPLLNKAGGESERRKTMT